jgi:hypothetical protein
MEDDIYQALIGEPPTEQEKLAAIATKLRGQRRTGNTAAILGGRFLGEHGENRVKQADVIAEQIGQMGSTNRWRKTQDEMNQRNLEQGKYEFGEQLKEKAKDRQLQLTLEAMQQRGANSRSAMSSGDGLSQKDLAKARWQYGKALDATGLPALEQGVGDVNKVLAPYEGKNIPGIFPGRGFVPGLAMGEEGRTVNTAIQGVRNILLKARSGGAVTEDEGKRLEDELFGVGATDKSFREGWQFLQNKISAQRNSLDAGAGQDIVDSYRSERDKLAAPAGAPTSAAPTGRRRPSFEEWQAGQR